MSFTTSIDVIINVAAQTIRGIERHTVSSDSGANRYGDRRHFPDNFPNSWRLRLGDIDCVEIEEVFRINAIAPLIIFQTLLPLMLNSVHPHRMVINAHAREGLFNAHNKSSNHPHTNMAKSALHQLTLMINRTKFDGDCSPVGKIRAFGIDPGWVSMDEYGMQSIPRIISVDEIWTNLSECSTAFLTGMKKKFPSHIIFQNRMPSAPLTELDGACRLLHPLLSSSKPMETSKKTIRHFFQRIN